MARTAALKRYQAKRNFDITPEPAEGGESLPGALQFVVQKHWARSLHYDFRIEIDGTMKSWAVPKGPSYDPHDKRMAMHVEDHPVSYNAFEGEIPPKQYGAGKVIVWDKGFWVPLGNVRKDYRAGHIKFELHGHKLRGRWALVRMKARKEGSGDPWLLIKERDEFAREAAEFSVVDQFPDSVAALAMPQASAVSKPAAKKAARKRSEWPEEAVEAEPPPKLAPVLATLVDGPPPDPGDWVYEIKFDGYRLLARIEGKTVRLFTRNGHDWSDRMPHLVRALQRMKLKPGWLDGEIVVLDEAGRTDFQALQSAFDSTRTQDIVYFLFDLPYYDGHDLRAVPLVERRALLERLLADPPPEIRFSAVFDAPPEDIVASACRIGLEGVIGKRRGSAYRSRRSPDWIKLKCARRQEFVIAGYTDPQGSRTGFGSLLLGVHDEHGELVFAGGVGTGFNERSLAEIFARLEPLVVDQRPFKQRIENERRAHWVKPVLVA
ncbi:non-homologous end-joining DNA ligase, partial [Variovorax sp.]|uniref:non-homologous end-joining DNA ligase n=1 Tax=Variovorax sp. TaxID=1871043 RepID=UPI0037DA63CF